MASFLKSLFTKKHTPINSYSDFWNWFQKNESAFFKVIKERGDIPKHFFDVMAPKLDELKDGFWFLAGMYDDHTAELIITADGVIKNIVFVEELVAAAPKIDRWRFTALKPPSDFNNTIEMDGYQFNAQKMQFYSNDYKEFPDEIDITIVHEDFNNDNKDAITNGVYIFLDNSLGELKSAVTIDNLKVIATANAEKELIPLQKLKDFLIWREKEFVEKYEGIRYNTENDNYSGLEATLNNGLPLFAVINMDLLNWDAKASHPWIVVLEIKYDGTENNGLPDKKTYSLLNEIEDDMMNKLKDFDGYLNVGRQSADNLREVYFACMDFRKPSKIINDIQSKYANQIEIQADIYKDKYWQSFNRFLPK